MPIYLTDALSAVNHGERHIPVVLVVDESGSMKGAPMDELNQGLVDFGTALEEDSLALGRAEICVIGFDTEVRTEVGFRPAAEYTAPTLNAGGFTALNEAIEKALDVIEERKELYRSQGIEWYRPWLFVLTDGEATDTDREAAAVARLRAAVGKQKVVYMPMAIGANANKEKLRAYYPEDVSAKPVLTANAASFKEAFVWLSNSIGVVSHSNPMQDSTVPLPPLPADVLTIDL